jgi:predicted permease
MSTLLHDLRYGLRMLAKNAGFTVIAVLTLALGIGANTAIFSILNQVLLRRLPVKHPEELVLLKSPGPKSGHVWSDGDDAEIFSYPLYLGLAKNTAVFDGVIARFTSPVSISSHGQTDRGSGELVSGNYFQTLGVGATLGRLLAPEDNVAPGAHPVVVLSHGYWTQHFGADPGVLNQAIQVNTTEMTIVGVAQAGFTGVQVGQAPDLFVPIMMKAQMTPNRSGLDDWNDSWLAVLARRKPGVSLAQAQAGINAAYQPLLTQQLATIHGWDQKKRDLFLNKKILLSSGAQGRITLQRDSGPALITLFAMVALVLLIACTNLANLLLAKGAARQREFAIRSAIGASRGRIVRQLMTESFLCACAGGGLGLLVGAWLMNILTQAVVSEAGAKGLISKVDGTILGFAIGATVVSGLLFGVLPAWRVTRATVSQMLKDQGSTTSAGPSNVRFRKFLVAGQVAFTLLLLIGASLFARSLWNLRQQDLGLKTKNIVTFSISPELNGYDTPRTVGLVDRLRERVAALPGVRAVGTSQIAVLTGTDMGRNIAVEGKENLDSDERHVNFDAISPNYFSTLGMALLSGREFDARDTATSTKVAIINEALVKTFLSGRDPIGMHFALGNDVKPEIEIVGVVRNAKESHVRDQERPYFYLPYSQFGKLNGMSFYVRTQQDPLLLSNELRAAVRDQDATLPVYDLKSVQRVVDEDLFNERVIAGLSASFGGLAALLAALGIYGVLAYLVVQRTREIGIRIALGADAGDVRTLIYREVGFMVLAGAVVGLPAAYGLARLSESMLFGVHASDVPVYLVSLGMIFAVAIAACYNPSRRATRIDPIVALRYE